MQNKIKYTTFHKVILIILLIIALGFNQKKLFNCDLTRPLRDSSTYVEFYPEDVQKLFPLASGMKAKNDKWTEIYDKSGKKLGIILNTSPWSDKEYAYAGDVPFLIGIDTLQKINGIFLLPNYETPRFIRLIRITGFFNSWDGLTVPEAIDKSLDAITGATVTSNTVIKNMKVRLSIYIERKYKEENSDIFLIKNLCVVLLLILALGYFIFPKLQKYRMILLFANVLILGFWSGSMVSLVLLSGWVANGIHFNDQFGLTILLLVSLLIPLLTNRNFYCYYLCPFGCAQELAGKISKKKYQPSKIIGRTVFYLREILFLLVLLILLIGVTIDLTYFEPFSAFVVNSASIFTLILAGIFILLSIFVRKPWCTYFCPTGHVLNLFRNIFVNWNLRWKTKREK